MEAGDWIYFDNMGAYTLALASTFNGFMKPRIHYVVAEFHALALNQIYQSVIEFQDAAQKSEFSENNNVPFEQHSKERQLYEDSAQHQGICLS